MFSRLRSHNELQKQQLSESSVASSVVQTKSSGQYKPGDVLYELLTANNYIRKFQELLKCEESTHKSILAYRYACNIFIILIIIIIGYAQGK